MHIFCNRIPNKMNMMKLIWTVGTILTIKSFITNAFDMSSMLEFAPPCEKFQCTNSKVPVQRPNYIYTENGCGAANFPIASFIDFSPCCKWHDACYSTCGMKKDSCDKKIEKCFLKKCKSDLLNEDEKKKCDSTVNLISIGVKMLGCETYQEAQKMACKCVPSVDKEEGYRQYINGFIENYTEGDMNSEDINELLEKYVNDESKLLLKLLKKYPKALTNDRRKPYFMQEIFKYSADDIDAAVEFTKGAEKNDNKDSKQVEEQASDEHIEL